VALGSLRQEDLEVKASLGYIVKLFICVTLVWIQDFVLCEACSLLLEPDMKLFLKKEKRKVVRIIQRTPTYVFPGFLNW
jgi:hypothetical protein